ncbi:sortase [Nocardioides sp. zg-536]|uniref:Sortase n=1 Tax=Nocardioides faecalis TaxID=2803858 RepID=A0A938Y6F7_9ACTN|nr:sortase [Nocardioides faecalis]MBM9460130.1 sortase [Nocardioides faecalis]QVI60075.1 sortase [Nocardioides faecalis]
MTAFLIAATALAVAPASSAAPPTGGSTIVTETFTGATVADPAWTVQGRTCLTGATDDPPAGAASIPTCADARVGDVPEIGTPGYLQLTDERLQTAGSVLYNRPVPASAGVSITFDQFQYGGTGADGIGFFLVDGATDLTATGAPGGSLGYAQRRVGSGAFEPGVDGGLLGVGLDAYGNYYDDGEARGNGCPADQGSPSTADGSVAPNVITLRGPGQGTVGYCYLASTTPAAPADPDNPGTTLNGGTGTLRARTLAGSWRQVNIQVTPAPEPRVIVQVRYNPADADDPWITELDVPAPAGLPSTYKFGLSAATGGQNDVHLIRNAVVQSVVPLSQLQLEKQVDRSGEPLPAVITPGTVIPYQYTVTNAGQETLSTLDITDDRITGAITCDSTTLPPAPAPGSTTVCRGTYTVTAADAAAGSVQNTATATAVSPGGDNVISPEASVRVPLVSALALTKTVQTPGPYEAGQEIEYQYTVRNTGGSTVSNIDVTDDRVGSAALVCEENLLDPGISTTCTGTYVVDAEQADAAGRIVNTAVASGVSPIGQNVRSPEAQATITLGAAPALSLEKTASPATVTAVGQQVTYSFLVTNTGNVPVEDIAVVEDSFTGSGTLPAATCPAEPAELAPGDSVVCTSVYTVTAADLDGAGLRNTARGTGTYATGEDLSSSPDSAVVEVDPPVTPPRTQPRIRTRTSQERVKPGQSFYDRVLVSGLAPGTSVPATARLYGPFSSRARASCGRSNLARTVRWSATNGWSRTPAVKLSRPGIYTWQVSTRETGAAQAASTRCGLASETTTVAKPRYAVPVIDGGFSGFLGGQGDALARRAVQDRIKAPGFGLRARVMPTTTSRGRMKLSSDVAVTAWLRKSARFGDKIGATVVGGHVSDWSDRPGAMWGLRRAKPGQSVTVRSAGKTYRYKVIKNRAYDRNRKLPKRYFRTTGAHRLVLISCSDRTVYRNGRFHYTKSRVVVAKLVKRSSGR